MSEEQAGPLPESIGIADANLPADRGLSGLGLVMSLTGAVFTVIWWGLATMTMFTLLLAGGDLGREGGPILVTITVIAMSLWRSWAHRAAGQRLLYDGPGTPRSALRRYYRCSILQIVVVLLALASQGVPGEVLGVLCVALAGWPVALAIALGHDRFRTLLGQQTIPQGDDRGFEGAAILMVVLGLTGLLFAALLAVLVGEQLLPLIRSSPFTGLSLLAIMALMIVRSALHVRAGIRGVGEAHCDRATEAVARYGNAAVLAGAVICGLLFLMVIAESRGGGEGIVVFLALILMAFLMWGLTTWPVIIKRFFVERQFADLLSTGGTPHARAPDRGLTTLGWFLFGQAVLGLSTAVPALVTGQMGSGGYPHAHDPFSEMLAVFAASGRSQWWSIGITVLELVAAWQLIRMRPSHRRIVTLWSVAAALVAVYLHYPMIQMLLGGTRYFQLFGDTESLLGNLAFIMVAIALVVPITTLVLVNRKQRNLPMAVLQQ